MHVAKLVWTCVGM